MSSQRSRRRKLIRLSKYQNDLCFYCEQPVLLPDLEQTSFNSWEENKPERASFDHVTPVISGGSNSVENLVIACRDCNNKKGDSLPSFEHKQKLIGLNQTRICEIVENSGSIDPSTFGPITNAQSKLISLLNELKGFEGQKLKNKVNKRITNFSVLAKQLESVQDKRARTYMLKTMYEDCCENLEASQIKDPFKSLTRNVIASIYKENIKNN